MANRSTQRHDRLFEIREARTRVRRFLLPTGARPRNSSGGQLTLASGGERAASCIVVQLIAHKRCGRERGQMEMRQDVSSGEIGGTDHRSVLAPDRIPAALFT